MNKVLERVLPGGAVIKILELGAQTPIMVFGRLLITVKSEERKDFCRELSNLFAKYKK